MKRIESFCVNHDKLTPGMYLSRIDGDAVTYDVRMVTPNAGVYLENDGIHTFEHLFATYVRNTADSDNILYVGPMGCRTGFYLLMRGDNRPAAIKLVRDSFKFISEFSGEIPGATEPECGNYLEHDLDSAKKDVLPLLKVLEDYPVEKLIYPD